VHNVNQWPNLRHLAEAPRKAVVLSVTGIVTEFYTVSQKHPKHFR